MTDSDRPTIQELVAVGGNTMRRVLRLLGAPHDAYVLIGVRNTPEIDKGSDQVLATNVSDEQNLLEILKWHVGVVEERIAAAASGKQP